MEAPAIRQRMTLSDQLSVLQSSSNLRDLLKFRDDASAASARPHTGSTVTLATVLEAEMNAASSSSAGGGAGGRTLLDVIREEESRDAGGGSSSRWRDLTDRLRIRPASTWAAGSASTLARDRSASPSAADRSGSGTIRVSLMTLMELREREEEGEEESGRAAVMAVAEVDDADVAAADDDKEEEEEMEWGRERQVCCVCMVRRKGAAFIPCGHTFCRVCSRELLVGRGNCPLCNAAILEVLDIF